ncbi:MAG: hypothetical protein U1G07_14045 [Verrucomicrobiota bacterium]
MMTTKFLRVAALAALIPLLALGQSPTAPAPKNQPVDDLRKSTFQELLTADQPALVKTVPPPPACAAPVNPAAITEELKPLQGQWEGEGAGGKCAITITGNRLLYRNDQGWHKATFTLPKGASPHQLHATIIGSSASPTEGIGTVVYALYTIENGTLRLGTYDGSGAAPKTFDDTRDQYTVQKIKAEKSKSEASSSK